MRYVSFSRSGATGVGVLHGDNVVPLLGVSEISAETDQDALASAAPDHDAAFAFSEATLLPTSTRPRRIICVGLNYYDHVAETRREVPQYPVLFTKFASNLIGATDDIALPPESDQPDYEGELAVVIGRGGRRIPRAQAIDHVLGYSVANDVTMRDFQYKTHQWLQGKSWDHSTPLGPVLVTPDEVDLTTARLRTSINGELMQDGALADLMFDIPRLISDISTFTMLEAGDVILTGTPGGVGYRREPQVFLKPDDLVAVEIDGIGRIENRVVDERITT